MLIRIFSTFESVTIAVVLTFVFLHLLITLFRVLFPPKPPGADSSRIQRGV
jgi:hypothetical protein